MYFHIFCRIFANISFLFFFVKRQRPGPRGRTHTDVHTCVGAVCVWCVLGVCVWLAGCECDYYYHDYYAQIAKFRGKSHVCGSVVCVCVWKYCTCVCVCLCVCAAATNERQPQIAAVFSLHFPIVSQNGVRGSQPPSPPPPFLLGGMCVGVSLCSTHLSYLHN